MFVALELLAEAVISYKPLFGDGIFEGWRSCDGSEY